MDVLYGGVQVTSVENIPMSTTVRAGTSGARPSKELVSMIVNDANDNDNDDDDDDDDDDNADNDNNSKKCVCVRIHLAIVAFECKCFVFFL
ncbi:MAG: hypothetical protein ACRYE7_01545 [Janthinobacterium lividum]